ncbi:hypothetical protein EXIGLDRAFT_572684, partial [Exidia glandulosa HHB12029]
VFLGFDWLEDHNPLIDWKALSIVFGRCPRRCGMNDEYIKVRSVSEYIQRVEAGDFPMAPEVEEYVRAFSSKATEIAAKAAQDGTTTELPSAYRDFADIFAKTEFDKLPE